jgi:hypothetical protein
VCWILERQVPGLNLGRPSHHLFLCVVPEQRHLTRCIVFLSTQEYKWAPGITGKLVCEGPEYHPVGVILLVALIMLQKPVWIRL